MRVLCHWYHEIQWKRHLFCWIVVKKDIFAFIPNHLHWHFWSLEIYLYKAVRPDFLIIFNLPFLIIICMMSPKGRKRIIHSFDVLFSLKIISKIVRFYSSCIKSYIFCNQISLPLMKCEFSAFGVDECRYSIQRLLLFFLIKSTRKSFSNFLMKSVFIQKKFSKI